MINKTFSKLLIFIVILCLIISSSSATSLLLKNKIDFEGKNDNIKRSSGNIIYVDDDGDADYTNIQDAIDNASDGDTIFVYNGQYTGFKVKKTKKRLNIIGESRKNTFIKVNKKKRVRLIGDGCVLSRFTIEGNASFDYFLQAGGNNVTVSNCNVFTKKGQIGIEVGGTYSTSGDYKKENILIKNCEVKGFNWMGIEVYLAYNSRIENCTIHKCDKGIDLWEFDGPHNNYVYNCEIFDNNIGIFLDYSRDYVSNCYIHDNKRGLELYTAKRCQVTRCIIENNSVIGCYIYPYTSNIGRSDTKLNLILGNTFINNKRGICLDFYTIDNQIHHNNFVNNSIYNAFDKTNTNKWDDGEFGNYWDDYTGEDNDGDGIGDTPYIIRGYCMDHYPSINPISMKNIRPDKPIVIGETTGIQNVAYTFSAITYDPDFDFVFYKFDWGDNTTSEWLGPFAYNISGTASHIWRNNGSYNVRVIAKDIKGLKSSWSEMIQINISNNKRPEKPIISGPSEGIVGYNTTFSALTTDQDNDPIRYCFDFGNNRQEWTEYYSSGEKVTLTYTWDWPYLKLPNEKIYNVKVKAQDIKGAESKWSDSLAITIKNNPPTIPIVEGTGEGRYGEKYKISLVSTDPDNHWVAFDIRWGDGGETWTGGHESGKIVNKSHSYLPGNYTIKVRAYDQYHAVSSDWATHEVVIKKTRTSYKTYISNLLQHILQYYPTLKNSSLVRLTGLIYNYCFYTSCFSDF